MIYIFCPLILIFKSQFRSSKLYKDYKPNYSLILIGSCDLLEGRRIDSLVNLYCFFIVKKGRFYVSERRNAPACGPATWKCSCLWTAVDCSLVKRLPDVVSALNNKVTSIIRKNQCCRDQRQGCYLILTSSKYSRPVGFKEKKLPALLINVWHLYQPGELEGGTKLRGYRPNLVLYPIHTKKTAVYTFMQDLDGLKHAF